MQKKSLFRSIFFDWKHLEAKNILFRLRFHCINTRIPQPNNSNRFIFRFFAHFVRCKGQFLFEFVRCKGTTKNLTYAKKSLLGRFFFTLALALANSSGTISRGG